MPRFTLLLILLGAWLLQSASVFAMEPVLEMRKIFVQQVDRRLDLPQPEQHAYAAQVSRALRQAGINQLNAQYLLLVDRSPQVQAAMLFWLANVGTVEFIGASPASTGKRDGFEHFETPLGVFDHAAANTDFRAQGTRNGYGIRGYGAKGMRVYDFGWVTAQQTWRHGEGPMRLQLHTTDPDYLEPLLGTVQSKGCIRIPAALNKLIDHYGLLDAGYEQALAGGEQLWLPPADREPTPWSGRYLIIMDSGRTARPDWSPLPAPSPPSPPAVQPSPLDFPR